MLATAFSDSSFAPQLWGQVSEKKEPGGLWPLQVHAEKVTQAPPKVLCLGEPREIRGKSNFASDFDKYILPLWLWLWLLLNLLARLMLFQFLFC